MVAVLWHEAVAMPAERLRIFDARPFVAVLERPRRNACGET